MVSRPDPALGRVQEWMQAVLLAPAPVVSAIAAQGAAWLVPPEDVTALVPPSRTLSSCERLEIYRRMVAARFRQVLAADYEAVAAVLGRRFSDLAADYVAARPSRSCTLAELGSGLPHFLRTWSGSGGGERAALVELARLERAVELVFHLPSGSRLAPDEVVRVRAADWDRTGLRAIPSLRLLRFDHQVDAAYDAHMGGSPALPLPGDCRMAVYRSGGRRMRLVLEPREHDLLVALVDGAPLGRVVGEAAGVAPHVVGRWLRRWTRAGLFAGLVRTK